MKRGLGALAGFTGTVILIAQLGGCPPCPVCEPNEVVDPNQADPNDVDDSNKPLHQRIFTDILPQGYEGPESCMVCHSDIAHDLMDTGHWNWSGVSVNIDGHETEVHGKIDLINNFCIAVPSNEGRCSQCHPSYGWSPASPPDFFDNRNNVDCLVCHDTTGTYRKHPSATGGGGDASLVIDGQVTPVEPSALQEVAYNVGTPTRHNCGLCHYYAGGGDNVKHGDLSSTLSNPTRADDVHMGGLDFSCQRCHTVENHGTAGFALHSVDEGGAPPDCTRCHGETNVHQANPGAAPLLNQHLDRVACQTCHIPAFARSVATVTEWYWSAAGEDRTDIPQQEGRPTYDKMKGEFVWQKNVQPVYLWYDGKWARKIVNVADTYAEAGTPADPVVIAAPTAGPDTPGAKLYPFKRMIGDQPADTINKRLLVPHLFGTYESVGLTNPYWGGYDWKAALIDGTAYAGQPFDPATWTVENGFASTVMYLAVNHEIAPATEALFCNDCHGVPSFWTAIGVPDPLAQN